MRLFFKPPRKLQRKHLSLLKNPPYNLNESADKPGSVVNNHLSGINITIDLKQPTRTQREQRYEVPIWPYFQWGLPCRTCYQVRGALLPHHFTLTILQWRFIFCGTDPVARAIQTLSGTAFCEARTFLCICIQRLFG